VNEEERLGEAIRTVRNLGAGSELTTWIASVERALEQQQRQDVVSLVRSERLGDDVLAAALLIKGLAGQINVIIHAVGIVASLPYILEDGEVVRRVSLGAGNTGRAHDLETDRRIAEFKFVEWRGGSESIRQNNLFADVFNLISTETSKRRVLYVLGREQPLRFLSNRRALTSVLSKNMALERRFREANGERFKTVHDYWETVQHMIEIVDLREIVPGFGEGLDS
jgi:hypothetical protein